jgi:hypothetical protein
MRFVRPHLNRKKLGVVEYTFHSKLDGECKLGKLLSRMAWGKAKITTGE